MQSIKSNLTNNNLTITTPIFIGMFIGTYILYNISKFNISKFNIYYTSRSE
jgi:hypothetical protein